MNMNYFLGKLSYFEKIYNPTALFEKIRKIAKTAGITAVYYVLVLYYASFNKSISLKDRIMVLAAMGYFICPLDLLPDAMPGGFADDAAAMAYVIRHIWKNLTPEILKKARGRLEEFFGPVPEAELVLPA